MSSSQLASDTRALYASAAPVAWPQRLQRLMRLWAPWGAVAGVAILLCMAFVDHPVARYVLDHRFLAAHTRLLSSIPIVILAGASVGVVVVGTMYALRGSISPTWRYVLFAGLACCVALTLKTEAKYLFGRLPPFDWYWHGGSVLRDFRPLHREGSFPSGHMTAMWSIAPFIWLRKRWLRGPWILASLGVAYALAASGVHFVSDLIGGCLLGATVGYLFLLAAERQGGCQAGGPGSVPGSSQSSGS